MQVCRWRDGNRPEGKVHRYLRKVWFISSGRDLRRWSRTSRGGTSSHRWEWSEFFPCNTVDIFPNAKLLDKNNLNLFSTGDPNLAAIAQETTGNTSTSSQPPTPGLDDIPKGLATWREALTRSYTSAQLAMCQYSLEASIAWDKSIMKAVSATCAFSRVTARKYNSKLSVGCLCAYFLFI